MIEANIGVSGRYKLIVSKDEGCDKVVKETPWFSNLITNAGMDDIGRSDFLYNSRQRVFAVGSGNTTPAFTDTALETTIVSATKSNSLPTERGTDGSVAFYRYSHQFAQGQAAGNIAEVGFGRPDADLFSRSLVVDSNGNPTTITVLSNEFLTIVYEFRANIPQTDFTETQDFNIEGTPVSTNITMRANGATSSQYWAKYNNDYGLDWVSCGDVTMRTIDHTDIGPYHTNQSGFTKSIDTYSLGSHKLVATVNIGINNANTTNGINFFEWRLVIGIASFKAQIDPPLAKDNTKEISLKVGCTWTRA